MSIILDGLLDGLLVTAGLIGGVAPASPGVFPDPFAATSTASGPDPFGAASVAMRADPFEATSKLKGN